MAFRTFSTSTHARHWLFAAEGDVVARRQATHETVVATLAQTTATAAADDVPPPALPREDGELLCAFYELKLQELCKEENGRDPARFTNRVLYTAQTFFKRFYLYVSPMEEEPKGVMLAALYLAGKVEEERIQLPDLVPKYAAKLQPAALLAVEVRLLEALRFQLVVRSPFRCLTGVLQDLHGTLAARPDGAAESVGELEGLHQRAIECVCASLRTDAPFVHAPQHIALAALLSAAAARDGVAGAAELRAYVEQRFGREAPRGGGAADAATLLEQIARVQQASCMHDLDAEGTKERLKTIDGQLRKLTKHMKRVHKAREDRIAAAENERRQQRQQAKAGEHEVENARLVVKLEQVKAEAQASTAALAASSGLGASDANAVEPFVVRKRRRSSDEGAQNGQSASAAAASEPSVVKIDRD